MKAPNVKCLYCQKACYMPRNRLTSFKYCSRLCKNKMNTIKIKANCKVCGNEFTHISARCNKAKYCSRICYYKSQSALDRGTKDYKCHHCEIEFKDSPSVNRKYCSKSCVNKSNRLNWHPKYSTVRNKMIKEGLIEKCQKCGYDQFKEILGVHHIDKNKHNNDRSNLLVVCPTCHSLIHQKHIVH